MPNHPHVVQGFLVQLRQDDNETAQLDALSQLNELLSISNEESLSVFPVEQLVPVLVRSFRGKNRHW
jgi:E3 ubiquitin-protein ligase TRIP12